MSKIVILALIVAVIWWFARSANRRKAGKSEPDSTPQQMVACGHCGLYLPRNEAVPQVKADPPSGKFYCCEEHRRLAG